LNIILRHYLGIILLFLDSGGCFILLSGGFLDSSGCFILLSGDFILLSLINGFSLSYCDVRCPDQVFLIFNIIYLFLVYPEHLVFNLTDQVVHFCKCVWIRRIILRTIDRRNNTYNLGLPKECNEEASSYVESSIPIPSYVVLFIVEKVVMLSSLSKNCLILLVE